MMARAVFLVLLIAAPAFAQTDFKFKQARIPIAPGQTVTFEVEGAGVGQGAEWSVDSSVPDLTFTPENNSGIKSTTLVVTRRSVEGSVAYTGSVGIRAAIGETEREATLILTPGDVRYGGDIVTAIAGFEQAGASSADSDQDFFFDFFISRPLPGFRRNDQIEFGPAMRWWGDVRIASYPQQVTTSVAEFARGFAAQIGAVKVNEVAKFGEFRTGLEFRVGSLPKPFVPFVNAERQNSSVGVMFYYGALGAFHSPTKTIDIFDVPKDPNTPQAQAFQRKFPVEVFPDLRPSGTKYVAFTAPDRDQFYHQYGAGIRLTTRFYDSKGTLLPSPAMVAVSVGQNELVSAGQLRGLVGKFEGFYPFPLGPRDTALVLYLFGRANMKLGRRATESTPLILNPAQGVSRTDPGIAILSEASRRDLYTLGIGIDVSRLITKLWNPN